MLCNKVFICISLESYMENCCYLWSMAGPCGEMWCFHEDIVTLRCLPHYWLFVKGINRSPVDFHHKGLNNAKLYVFSVASLGTTLIKQSNYQWFQMPWCSYDNSQHSPMLHEFINNWFGWCDIHTFQCQPGYVYNCKIWLAFGRSCSFCRTIFHLNLNLIAKF